MYDWPTIKGLVIDGLIQNFVWVILGVMFARTIQAGLDRFRYGGWRVIVKKRGKVIVNRAISVDKTKEVLIEPAELAVFLKGVASPYDWINCDLIEEGKKIRLYVQDEINKKMILNLDKNPRPKRGTRRS